MFKIVIKPKTVTRDSKVNKQTSKCNAFLYWESNIVAFCSINDDSIKSDG